MTFSHSTDPEADAPQESRFERTTIPAAIASERADTHAPTPERPLGARSSRDFENQLRRVMPAVNLFIAGLAFVSFMAADRQWDRNSDVITFLTLTGMVAIFTVIVPLIMGALNRPLFHALDAETVSGDQLLNARKCIVWMPLHLLITCAGIWLVFIPLAVQQALNHFSSHTHSLWEIQSVMFAFFPVAVAAEIAAYEFVFAPVTARFFPDGGVRRFRTWLTPTVRKRLVLSFLFSGPYLLIVFGMLVYRSAGQCATVSDVLGTLAHVEIFLLGVSIVLLCAVMLYIRCRIDKPLAQLYAGLTAVRGGDLQTNLPIESVDDWGVIAENFNGLVVELQEKEKLSKENIRLMDELSVRAKEALELLALYKEASDSARIDPLSSLYNRRAFEEFIAQNFVQYSRYEVPFSLVICDIDHFKKINDTYGHSAGDHVIRSVANCIKTTARLSDVAARWGGEEFICCLPHTDLESATTFAERIRAECERMELQAADGNPLPRTTISVGVTTIRSDDHIFDTIIERADKGLYQAKESGRNRVCSIDVQLTAESTT